ncbi:endonuclease [Bacillus manliponensis]|uniref:Endonuclease n=1 Tax=Bacillus manliponensis TaxID=574376 RepID=A0A073K3S6_9BACI|nr:endonuclease/exonuclease/phosphatase family protein [Bacillus manliponensis]KEK21251.1 endonuclease [Bacillus manliponensis]
MKKIVKILLGVVGTIFGAFAAFLAYVAITDVKHKDVEKLKVANNNERVLKVGEEFKTTTFNIGYGGLDKDQDFFLDGGTGSRSSSKEQTVENTNNMLSFLQKEDSDFMLVQEMDEKSLRSFDVNQYKAFQEGLPNHASTLGYNFNAQWVPVPITKPHGYANGGLGSFSKYKVEEATRYQLPGREMWIRQLFELERAIVEHKVPVDNGKYLRMVNVHLSAYDKGGSIRKQQVAFLKEYINKHYKNGDYIVLGGDWNQLLSDVQLSDPEFKEDWPEWLVQLPEDFTDGGFQWAVDDSVWTVRDNVKSYVEGENFVTIIDGFLVSPNVEIVSVQGHDLKFENSDHNPVSTVLKLK